MRHRKSCLGLALAAGFLVLAPAPPARATLMLQLYYNGTLIDTFVDGGHGDTNTNVGNLNVDTTLLTAEVGTHFIFTSLGATSNATTSANASLQQTSNFTSTTRLAGGGTLEFIATDTGYTTPPAPTTLTSSGSTTSTNGTDPAATFESYFNPSNAPFATDIPAPLITLDTTGTQSDSDTTMGMTPPISPFGLTNDFMVSLARSTRTITRNVQTTGTTTVSAVPEPATLIMAGFCVPVLALAARRRRARG